MVVGLLGILKAGGAYLPLDPNYPRERLGLHAGRRRRPVLVTQRRCSTGCPTRCRPRSAAASIVRLDADWPAIARQPDTAPPLDLDPRHPAYVIYTSGSTGTPKGVVVEHASLANKMLALGNDFDVGGRLPVGAVHFLFVRCVDRTDAAAVHRRRRGCRRSATTCGNRRRSSGSSSIADRVTFMSCVPSYLESILQPGARHAVVEASGAGRRGPTLQFKNKVSRRLKVAQITNLYGPTETTIDAISHAVAATSRPQHPDRPADGQLSGLCAGRRA